ncbi:MAG TPA: excinuclease ABC subunit UvrA [bacterium]|nr:excinuclease ABC subunit UvrA [bacterium]
MTEEIIIRGAKTHNLKNIDLNIPREKMVIFTGVSGSGKSSIVFDTVYTEAQRQLIETFSSFARKRLPKLSRPPVDDISNLSTAIVINQKKMGRTLRSTVGTATEVYTYLRMLYSRFGAPFIGWSNYFSFNHPEGMCNECKGLGKKISIDAELLIDKTKSLFEGAVRHPDYKQGNWMWREITSCGLFDIEKKLKDYSNEELEKLLYADNIPITKRHGIGIYGKNFEGIARKLERYFFNKAEDEPDTEKQNAYSRYFIYSVCPGCKGIRLNERARNVKLNGCSISELVSLELTELKKFLNEISISGAESLIVKMIGILEHLIEIGVGYLSLNRSVSTLSGGESQRVKMARQLDCNLINLMYILDEPTTGLHPRDNSKLIEMLRNLRDKGNSVLVVEHDGAIIEAGDWVVEIGPEAGKNGGDVIFSGTVEDLKKTESKTALTLNKKFAKRERKKWSEYYEIREAAANNLKNINVKIPKGVFTCITGVAGSGKSSLIHEVFLKQHKNSIVIDQTSIGRTSRAIPATYLGVFDLMRKEFSKSVSADSSLFSFNSKGACQKCKGQGTLSIELSFMDDVKMICDECGGLRYNEQVLKYKYKNHNISEYLNMTITDVINYFETPEIIRRLKIIAEVGLDYLLIGQPLNTLSGGEAQRLKLAAELHKQGEIYIMDEPTTGLHSSDIEKLMRIIKNLSSKNNTVIVIEHNLELIAQSDWVIDMGPEGGRNGGEIIAEGTPEDIIKKNRSYTGNYLSRILV